MMVTIISWSFFREYRPQKKIELYLEPAENLSLSDLFGPPGSDTNPDFIFTSPPFFDYEVYTDASTQSIQKYPNFDDWLHQWFLPLTLNNWTYLKVHGHLVYYLADCCGNTTGPLINFMAQFPDAHFRGQIALTNGKTRPIFLYVWLKLPSQ